MASHKYVPMPREDTYVVYRDGADIGMVWLAGRTWHADRYNMHEPQISEPTREAAAARLADKAVWRDGDAHTVRDHQPRRLTMC
jgi:hypothetical protein